MALLETMIVEALMAAVTLASSGRSSGCHSKPVMTSFNRERVDAAAL